MTRPRRERSDLVIVASSNPFKIAESYIRLGTGSFASCFMIVSIESRVNRIQWCVTKFGSGGSIPGARARR